MNKYYELFNERTGLQSWSKSITGVLFFLQLTNFGGFFLVTRGECDEALETVGIAGPLP